MAADRFMALDLGTSKLRCAVFDADGRLVSIAAQPLAYQSPPELAPLGRELSADGLRALLSTVIQEALAKARLSSGEIAAISATSQRLGMAFLDEEGHELYLGPNLDLRALMEGLAIDERHRDEVFAVTGHVPSFLFAPAKLKWFLANRPDTYSRIAAVLPLAEWLLSRLTGSQAIERSMAVETGLADVRTGAWAAGLWEELDLPAYLQRAPLPAGTVIGEVTPETADALGLRAGTPVALGGPDSQCGLLGMGVTEAQEAGVVVGWSAPVQMCTDKPVFDPRARIWTGMHVLPERWLLESSATEAGNAYRWLVSVLLGHDGHDGFAAAEAMVQEANNDSSDVMALLGPSAMNMSDLRMRFGGLLFPLPLSMMPLDRPQLLRAALENVAFAIRANLEQIEETSGSKAERFSLGGGLARSQVFAHMLADALGRCIEVASEPEVSALGAAMCAACGAGRYSTLGRAAKAMAGARITVEPGADADIAGERYQRWLATVQHMDALSAALG